MANSSKLQSWRDVLPVHPAAELFPRMSEPELRELGEDIKANGLRASIVLYEGKLLDGRNRLDAMELVGIEYSFLSGTDPTKWRGLGLYGRNRNRTSLVDRFDGDPYTYVISANIHRRHLTAEQKRALIEKLLKAKPEQSDRQIAKQTKTSPTTVGKIRKKSEAAGDVSKLDTRTDTKGRKQPSVKAKKSAAPPKNIIDDRSDYSEVSATSVPRLSPAGHCLVKGISRQLKDADGMLPAHDRTALFAKIRALVDPDDIVGEAVRLVEKMTVSQRRDLIAQLKKKGLVGAFGAERSAEISTEQRKAEYAALDEAAS
jgi:hypothetical protein